MNSCFTNITEYSTEILNDKNSLSYNPNMNTVLRISLAVFEFTTELTKNYEKVFHIVVLSISGTGCTRALAVWNKITVIGNLVEMTGHRGMFIKTVL